MKKYFDNQLIKQIISLSLSGIIILLCYLLFKNISLFPELIRKAFGVLSPFIYGIVFAYLGNYFFKKLRTKLDGKIGNVISAIFAIDLELIIILTIALLIVPQILSAASSLSSLLTNYVNNKTISQYINSLELSKDLTDRLISISTQLISGLLLFVNNSLPSIMNFFKTTFSTISNVAFGFVIAVYMLIDQERLKESVRRLFGKLLKDEQYVAAAKLLKVSIEKFSRFFSGKIITSAIMGLICYPILLLFKVEYPSLISLIIGLTNILPIFGPLIGTVISVFIVLITNPWHAFIVLILCGVIQVIDGNILGPKIFGDSVGLSSFLTFSSILIGGKLFGFWGILLGVPVVSVIYYFVKEKREI